MKLELKHLAPYLPYGLKFATLSDDDDKYYIDKERNTLDLGGLNGVANICMAKYSRQLYKIVLRPLSDLTKEIEYSGEKIKVYELLEVDSCDIEFIHFENNSFFQNQTIIKPTKCEFIYAMDVYNNIIQELLKYHFDIFNLIPQGLAIDINTLK